jgi:hypothetical protein
VCAPALRRKYTSSGSPCDGLPFARPQLDGHVIEQCVQAGDGHFKEGAWVKISEEYQNHPELQQLSKFVGKYGRLTRRYHGCAAPAFPAGRRAALPRQQLRDAADCAVGAPCCAGAGA